MWSFILVWCLAADFSVASPGCYYTPDTGVDWTMDSLVVRSGGIVTGSAGEYVLHGTVYITSADTVRIAPGSTLIFDDTGGGYEFGGRGTLLALGTAAQEILFTSYHGNPGDWFNVCPGRGAMNFCRIEYAAWGIVPDTASSISHCTIWNNQRGITIYGGSPYVGYNVITNNQFLGISVNNMPGWGSSPKIPCEPLIENNEIINNPDAGISIGCYTAARVKGNIIHGSDRGITFYLVDQSIVASNTITGNRIGVYCTDGSTPNLGDLANQDPGDDGGNQISGNIEHDLYNACMDTIQAEGNFWGTTDIPVIESHIFGPVDYIPLGETSVQQRTWGTIKSPYRR